MCGHTVGKLSPRERNDSKSRLAISNSFLFHFEHRCILRLPIFGRGFCRFHFDCERSFQIPTDWYLIFCQCRRCATYSASDMRVPPLVACWTSLYLRVGRFCEDFRVGGATFFTVAFRRVQRVYVDQAITTGATATNFLGSSILILQFFSAISILHVAEGQICIIRFSQVQRYCDQIELI